MRRERCEFNHDFLGHCLDTWITTCEFSCLLMGGALYDWGTHFLLTLEPASVKIANNLSDTVEGESTVDLVKLSIRKTAIAVG